MALASFTLSGLSFLDHFWLGSRSTKVVLILISFAAGVPLTLAVANKGTVGVALNRLIARLAPLAATPAGLILAIAVGLLILSASCAVSSWIFAKRDLSRLP